MMDLAARSKICFIIEIENLLIFFPTWLSQPAWDSLPLYYYNTEQD